MVAENLFQQYNQAQNNAVLLLFKGALSQDVLVELGNVLRTKVGFDAKGRRLFAIFIEMTQNIKNYSVEIETSAEGRENGVGIITIHETSDAYSITAGNRMRNSDVERVRQRCTHIKSLPYDELRVFHKEQMRAGPPDGSKGAGLGLIDMTMKANLDVEFSFIPINGETSFFVVHAIIKKG